MECRRAVLLAHFGEAFNPARCSSTCDVCRTAPTTGFESRDVTKLAIAALAIVKAVGRMGTMGHVVDVFRGGNSRAIKDRGHDRLNDHGAGKELRC